MQSKVLLCFVFSQYFGITILGSFGSIAQHFANRAKMMPSYEKNQAHNLTALWENYPTYCGLRVIRLTAAVHRVTNQEPTKCTVGGRAGVL